MITPEIELRLSEMAEGLVGSEIIKLAGEVKAKVAAGESIANLTIGDFNPAVFPIPKELKNNIIEAYEEGHTNYPMANGMLELRREVSNYIKNRQHLDYAPEEFLIASGARPLIYAAYQVIVDPNDTVIFPVPSWNNNHYTHLSHGRPVYIETSAEDNFMPTAKDLKPYISDATLIALCSPLNPTGTVFKRETLAEICDLVLAENKRRGPGEKPVYVLFDQIYWALTYGSTEHCDPVSLRPEMKDYTVFIDGLSKAFAATGVRVGWGFGPKRVIDKMKSVLSHIGAWAPKAEQIGTASFLSNSDVVDAYLSEIKSKIEFRLNGFYAAIIQLKNAGHPVDAIPPQAAMYLTVQFSLVGKTTTDGKLLETTKAVTKYLLDEANLAIVPFYAFGTDIGSSWYRLSVGTALEADINQVSNDLTQALSKLY
ncbi:MAG: aminotransferase class I/II-fold pyridoxal phosphate-dependent enzyme [Flavobacteriales bacterium]|nr:aminotransferase class I/II-fold pyridoxal phosphate-dependent enzyme [Flavobacteriales bacterium]